jgi:hypothetical protein
MVHYIHIFINIKYSKFSEQNKRHNHTLTINDKIKKTNTTSYVYIIKSSSNFIVLETINI